MKKLTNISNYWIVTFLFIAIKLCLHFLTNTNYELYRDEMLYFNMADHLSFGYATVPPLTGFFVWISKSLFGYSVFGLRLIPALLGALIGLTFLNKYSVIFLITGFLIAIIFSPHRKLLFNKYFYLAMAIAFIIALPNIAGNTSMTGLLCFI